jgi:hypothetical protein
MVSDSASNLGLLSTPRSGAFFERLKTGWPIVCLEEECDDYVEAEVLNFANIPTTLRLWLRSQDGLKIHGVSLTNQETLESAFILLDRGRTLPFKQFSAEYLARRVGMLYIKKIPEPNRDASKPKPCRENTAK